LPTIDADLNAGLIDEKEARRRRKYLEDESGFFGAMDGASRSCAATPPPACSSC
jgi:flagellar biosynthesis component FlhA